MEITCTSDERDLRIYINSLLHLHLIKANYLSLQSWLKGSKYKLYYIEIYLTGQKILLEYDSRDRWIKVLQLLDENI